MRYKSDYALAKFWHRIGTIFIDIIILGFMGFILSSFGFGFVTPQIGVSYNYTPDSLLGVPLILNKQ